MDTRAIDTTSAYFQRLATAPLCQRGQYKQIRTLLAAQRRMAVLQPRWDAIRARRLARELARNPMRF